MNACIACAAPLDNDAVPLKNGASMCPACYIRKYGKLAEKSNKPKRFDIDASVIVTIIVIGLVCGAGYMLFKHHKESQAAAVLADKEQAALSEQQRKEALAAHDAEVLKNEALRREELARTDALTKQRELQQRLDRDAMQAKQDAIRRAEQERVRALNAADAERRNAADAADAKRLAAGEADVKKQRASAIANAAAELAEARAKLAKAEALRDDRVPTIKKWAVVKQVAERKRDALWAQYRAEFPKTKYRAGDAQDISGWRDPEAGITTRKAGSGSVVQIDRSDIYKRNVAAYDSSANEVAAAAGNMAKLQPDVDSALATIADTKVTIDNAIQMLRNNLNATPEELKAVGANLSGGLTPPPPATPPTGPGSAQGELPKAGKVIVMKTGESIAIKSYFIAGDDVLIKDEAGVTRSLKKDDIDKFPEK